MAYQQFFTWLICISLITDILDGWIARRLNMMTEIGAKLDSIADIGTYIGAIIGVFVFKYTEFEPHFFSFFAFIGLFVFANLLSFIKFGKSASLHLYSSKIGGYLQGFFFFFLFVFGFYTTFYYIMISWGIASFLEHITIQLIIKEMKSNAKGLYWVLRERGEG
jgi:cardiolipin synthase